MDNSNEIMSDLKNKYGIRYVRSAMKFYMSNIPERIWQDHWKREPFPVQLRKMLGTQSVLPIVFKKGLAKSMKQARQFIFKKGFSTSSVVSRLIMFEIENNVHSKRFEFTNLCSELVNPYGHLEVDKLNKDIEQVRIIAIDNITFGTLYDKHEEVLLSWLRSLYNHRTEKKLVLGIEGHEEMEEAYPELYSFISEFKIYEVK